MNAGAHLALTSSLSSSYSVWTPAQGWQVFPALLDLSRQSLTEVPEVCLLSDSESRHLDNEDEP